MQAEPSARPPLRGLAGRAAALLTDAAFALPGIDRTEIHCDAGNTASAAVARALGYRLDRLQDHGRGLPAETGRDMVWVMPRDAYEGGEARRRARALRVG
ncbi:GNAT family protein [Actinomadura keratinilytica]|jgi:RimJ/RimL family protein N-acetyltransferase|uniref:N-acetyltransferase domain-containing protein n=2 Tax=Actinomadura keratinilytica TaxID=547461 RepID=A0ABP7Z5X9_9ACTN